MEAIVLFLLGLVGILVHVTMKFQDVVTKVPKNGQKFSDRLSEAWEQFDLLGNLVYGLLAVLVLVIVVVIRGTLNEIGFPVTKVTIIFIGYAADSTFKNLSNLKQ